MSWKLLGALMIAAIVTGCGSCQQTPPEPPAGDAAPVKRGAAKAVTTVARAPLEVPTARTLPTIGGAPADVQPLTPGVGIPRERGAAAPAAAPPGAAEQEDDEEADCSVIADADPDYGPPPLAVHFSVEYECTEGSASVAWDFGDGSSISHETAPTHTYYKAGDYVAIITVTTSDGLRTTDEIDITVEEDAVEE